MSARKRQRGFTLLEVLIASLLASTLLLGLWGLLGIYSRLFESGKAKTEQSQLARAIFQQLTDDLRGAIQDSTAPPPRLVARSGFQTSNVTRRFRLIGTRRDLRFDVLQIAPEQAFSMPEEHSPPDETEIASGRAPELRTVEYAFVDPTLLNEEVTTEDLAADSPKLSPGLTRRELTFDATTSREEDATQQTTVPAVMGNAMNSDDAQASEGILDEDDLNPLLTRIPEVVGLEFRYFDGRSWVGSWDSLRRRSLPVAVEARLKIESFDPRDHRRRREEETSLDGEVETVGAESTDGASLSVEEADAEMDDHGRRVYRLVIDLPTAALYRGAKAAADGATPSRIRAQTRPSTAPPVREERPQPRPRSSDQWMRTDSP